MSIKAIILGSVIGGLYYIGHEAIAIGFVGAGIVTVIEMLQDKKV